MTDLKTGVRDKLDPLIPPAKVDQMIGSVKVGLAVALLGLAIMASGLWILVARLLAGDVAVATLIVAGGIFLIGLFLALAGANTASNQVVKATFMHMKEPLEMLLRLWRSVRNGRNGNGTNGGTPNAG